MNAEISPRTIAIVQARMGSSRLPGKVLLEIAGRPMLARVVDRTRRARTVDEVVVATTTEPEDDPVAEFCRREAIPCTRGSLHDVLDRFYQAARQYRAEVVVRITGDCPLMDPAVVDRTVDAFLGRPLEGGPKYVPPPSAMDPFPYDFAANRLPPPWGRTYPIGLDVEVCTFEALELAWQRADQPHQREHVMPYLYEQEGRFRVLLVDHAEDLGSLRWTVDTPADLEFVRRVFDHFPGREDFSWLEVLDLVRRKPELAEINAGVQHKGYRDVDARGREGQS